MKPILEIQSISKKFRINHEQQPYLSMRDSIASIFKDRSTKEDFWALKDVSFDVMPGDTVGIIGKNGAGKSTLLKILSKITPPTSGKIIGRGRIASLLEVGTGFHPELSGRENIFMNGSILGMRHAEIQRNFDAIVDFAGVEKFLDTPLKHYSSGMQLRLAFAVAAFLENEILIIDEVLAVGDAEFQKKCIGKMEDVSKSGRTVLFVSHNMGSLRSICKKGIILDKGSLSLIAPISETVDHYLKVQSISSESFLDLTKYAKLSKEAHALSILSKRENGTQTNLFFAGEKLCIEIEFYLSSAISNFIIGIGIVSEEGANVRTVWSKPKAVKEGKHKAVFKEKDVLFGAGRYSLSIGLSANEINLQHITDCFTITFEKSENKELALRSDCGFVLNQMECEIY
ncbi:MAG: ABC transporter ATP-binding protein [Sphingobacteriaceae bacterium]